MEIFPATIAIGKAFCNRRRERKILKEYILAARPVVLMAPRRYGKTSLINQVLIEIKLPSVIMEFTLATSAAGVEAIIMKHVAKLLYQILPRSSKAKQKILKFFSWLHPEIVLTAGGQKIIFHPERSHVDIPDRLSDLLEQLDKAAKISKKHVVVVMDEFQQLGEMDDHTIEASIRKAMQYSKNVSYVFSGSNRHMLAMMFNNKNRPFYNSCEIMKINRISREDYILFISHAAFEKWNKPLDDETLNEILKLSELHPSYLNKICGYFWIINEYPTINKVQEYWQQLLEANHTSFVSELLSLSNNQRNILTYIAQNPTAHPSHQEVSHSTGISDASIRQAIRVLKAKDYLYRDKQGILRILDPALRDFILSVK